MIVDTPYITDLGVGTERRIIQEGDNQLFVPASAQAVIPLIGPNQFFPNSTQLIDQSFTKSVTFIHTNIAATITTLVRLAKGLWKIRFNGYFWSNYIGDPTGPDECAVRIKDEATGVLDNLYAFYPSNIAAAQTSYHQHEDEFLFFNTALIEVRRPTTGVGETIIIGTAIRASKIL